MLLLAMKKIPQTARKEYQKLKRIIEKHDYNYYVLDDPKITDGEYDKLYAEFLQFENEHPELTTPDSPSQRVGGECLDAFEKIKHRSPMLSLQNTYSPEEIYEFEKRVKKNLHTSEDLELFCQPKLDGLALELIYKNGKLVGAITRGDGRVGENVLFNVKTMKSVPLTLNTNNPPKLLEVRGEVVMLKKDFEKLNKQQEELGQSSFANPRNAAAGTLRQLDPKVTARRSLRIYCYAPGVIDGLQFKTQQEFEQKISELGLPTVASEYTELCKGSAKVIHYYKKLEKLRKNMKFEIDGIVIKVNDRSLQAELGHIARSPRWAVAAKYKPEQSTTLIEDIIVQIGRTGALTPVAIMKPVKVGGVTITHATLHNPEEVERKDVRVGDTIIVHRAGDVIPEVVRVIEDKRPKESKAFKMPKKCPSCKQDIVHSEKEVIPRCVNPACPAILKQSLKHFVSRRAMNIDKLGDKLIDNFVEQNLISTFSDIYRLKAEDLLKLEQQGEKSVENLINSIQASCNPQLAQFIYALGIRFVGEQTAHVLSLHFKSIDKLIKASLEDLTEVDDVGPKVATAIVEACSRKEFVKEITELQKAGIKIENPQSTNSGHLPLKGVNIVVTGTLPEDRDTIKDLILSLGGKSSSSVSKKTNYVLAGEAAGSKLLKAQELKVPVIDWDQFQKLIAV